jgi:hypothetical protein
MRIDSIAVELRPRPMFEAADLGVRLLQRNARMVARCWLPVALAVLLLALSSVLIATWLPAVLIFWFKLRRFTVCRTDAATSASDSATRDICVCQ